MMNRMVGIVVLAAGLFLSTNVFQSSLAQSPAPVDGLVGYWAFDETEGAIAADSSGNGHAGVLTGEPRWVLEGQVNGALQFDGVDDLVEVPFAPEFNLPNGLTLMGWFFADALPDVGEGNDWRLLIGRNGFSPYGLLLEQDARLSGSAYVAGERQLVQSLTDFPIGEWVHVAYTYNPINGVARIYINGQMDVEAVQASGSIDSTENRLRFSLPNSVSTPDVHVWKGRMDEIRVYARPLTDAEILSVFDSERTSS